MNEQFDWKDLSLRMCNLLCCYLDRDDNAPLSLFADKTNRLIAEYCRADRRHAKKESK